MILLNTTTDKLQIVTSAAVNLDVHASYMDMTDADPPVIKGSTSGRTNTAITTATTTDIVPVPAASTLRNVKTIHARNKSGTSVDVTVVFDQNGTDFELFKGTLLAGDELEYVEGLGFFIVTALDSIIRNKVLAADQSNSTTTLTEVTGLSLLTGTGTFLFEYFIRYQSAATTTGVRFSVNHTGTVDTFVANTQFMGVNALAADAIPDQDVVVATAALPQGFAARAKSTLGWGTTLSVDTANADMFYMITGLVGVTVDGDIELWHGSEVAAASTVKARSGLRLTRLGD